MTLILSILLYPIFFVLMFAVGEYIFPTKNGAMIFSVFSALLISYLYYTIRTYFRQLNKEKHTKEVEKQTLISRLMLADEDEFASYFNGKNDLADNSFSGINEDKLIEFLRANGCENKIEIYSVKGITQGSADLLNLLKISYTEHSIDEIFEKNAHLQLPTLREEKVMPPIKSIKNAVFTNKFKKFSIKYGVILLLFSFFTPYKIYYIIFGVALILWSVFVTIKNKIS